MIYYLTVHIPEKEFEESFRVSNMETLGDLITMLDYMGIDTEGLVAMGPKGTMNILEEPLKLDRDLERGYQPAVVFLRREEYYTF